MKKSSLVLMIAVLGLLGWALFVRPWPLTDAGGKAADHLEADRLRIKKAVEAGKLTREDAKAKLKALEKRPARKPLTPGEQRIQEAVVTGWDNFKRQHPTVADPGKKKKPMDKEAVRARIEEALASGKLTREQADAKLQWLDSQDGK